MPEAQQKQCQENKQVMPGAQEDSVVSQLKASPIAKDNVVR